jgi:hypothetical protein
VNFQVTVLKILVSHPDGFAVMVDLKRDMAILTTSGPDWAERTKRLASRVADLDIFSQALVERLNGGWRITEKGRAVLELMEARPSEAEAGSRSRAAAHHARGSSSCLDPARPGSAPPSRPRAGAREGFLTPPERLPPSLWSSRKTGNRLPKA